MEAQAPAGRKWRRLLLAFVLLLGVALGLVIYPLSIETRPWTKADLQQARRKLALLEKGTPLPPQVFSESEVNACLAADLNATRKSGAFKLKTIRVQLKPDATVLVVTATWAPTLAGGVRPGSFDIVYGITGVPEIGADGFRFAVSRGMIGHLPLPGPLALALAPQVKAYFRALRQNYPALGAVRRLELEEGKVTVFLGK